MHKGTRLSRNKKQVSWLSVWGSSESSLKMKSQKTLKPFILLEDKIDTLNVALSEWPKLKQSA